MNIPQRKDLQWGGYENVGANKSLYLCTRLLAGSYLIQRGANSYRDHLVTYDVRPWISLNLHGKQRPKLECTQ
jgi:hypothetical protein